MWIYEKKLEYPVRVDKRNPELAKIIMTQYGGPDGELAASLRYLNQRYTMPDNKTKALLTDIGTEELAHLEIVATLIYKLSKNADLEELRAANLIGHYTEHGKALYYADAVGIPFPIECLTAKDDPIADLQDDMAAEQRARATYNHLMNLTDDKGVYDTLAFLRQREINHFQRFGEALQQVQESYACKKVIVQGASITSNVAVAGTTTPNVQGVSTSSNVAGTSTAANVQGTSTASNIAGASKTPNVSGTYKK